MRSQIKLAFGRLFEKLILGPGDGIMLRRQQLTIKKNASSHNLFIAVRDNLFSDE